MKTFNPVSKILPVLLILALSFCIILLGAGCDKNDDLTEEPEKTENLEIIEGTFTGDFTVTYHSTVRTYEEATLELKNGKYTCNLNRDITRFGISEPGTYLGGSGTYSLNNHNFIFDDEHLWAANFDWNLILAGEYNYTFDNNKLKLWKEVDIVRYEYNFERE